MSVTDFSEMELRTWNWKLSLVHTRLVASSIDRPRHLRGHAIAASTIPRKAVIGPRPRAPVSACRTNRRRGRRIARYRPRRDVPRIVGSAAVPDESGGS